MSRKEIEKLTTFPATVKIFLKDAANLLGVNLDDITPVMLLTLNY